jgi:hypothetical protein
MISLFTKVSGEPRPGHPERGLHLQRHWPWANALTAAFTRVAALPPPAR